VETHGGVFTTHFNVHVTALIASAVDTEKYRVRRRKWRDERRRGGRGVEAVFPQAFHEGKEDF
jgi:hypothetical protein